MGYEQSIEFVSNYYYYLIIVTFIKLLKMVINFFIIYRFHLLMLILILLLMVQFTWIDFVNIRQVIRNLCALFWKVVLFIG
jgi:hypothetical protein